MLTEINITHVKWQITIHILEKYIRLIHSLDMSQFGPSSLCSISQNQLVDILEMTSENKNKYIKADT